mmetsp:Transcript_57450/g.125816  ORF Transcript_57450/g.125816 Transcript_57450/m.125816 type:complete len:112 (-) Transcript_57450:596-931(-)
MSAMRSSQKADSEHKLLHDCEIIDASSRETLRYQWSLRTRLKQERSRDMNGQKLLYKSRTPVLAPMPVQNIHRGGETTLSLQQSQKQKKKQKHWHAWRHKSETGAKQKKTK